jgi:hypothetical protein
MFGNFKGIVFANTTIPPPCDIWRGKNLSLSNHCATVSELAGNLGIFIEICLLFVVRQKNH